MWYVSRTTLVNWEYKTLLDEQYDADSTPATAFSGYGYECLGEILFNGNGSLNTYQLGFTNLRMQPFHVQSSEISPSPDGTQGS